MRRSDWVVRASVGLLGAVVLTSCGGVERSTSSHSLVGTWRLERAASQGIELITLAADGRAVSEVTLQKASATWCKSAARWTSSAAPLDVAPNAVELTLSATQASCGREPGDTVVLRVRVHADDPDALDLLDSSGRIIGRLFRM